jgi:Response regulator containing a CheY-like receiver domain and an HTH DNA-binding domain
MQRLWRELFLRHKPHLVVVGLGLCGADGIQLIKEFRSLNPVAAILALSEHADPFSVQRAFRAGARAYLTIDDAPELLGRSTNFNRAPVRGCKRVAPNTKQLRSGH